MPFTVNVGPYVGGQLLASGIQNFGTGISEGIQKAVEDYHKTQQEQGADQIILNYARQRNMISPQEEADYIKGSHAAKTGIVMGLTRKFALNAQDEQIKSLQAERQAQAELRKQQADALNFTPRMINLQPQVDASGVPFAQPVDSSQQVNRPGGVSMIETRKGVFEPATKGEEFVPPTVAVPVKDKDSGKIIGYSVPTSKTTAPFHPLEATPGQAAVEKRFQINEAIKGATAQSKRIEDQLSAAQIPDPSFLLDTSRHFGITMKDGKFNDYVKTPQDQASPPAYRVYVGQGKNNQPIYRDFPASRFRDLQQQALKHQQLQDSIAQGFSTASLPDAGTGGPAAPPTTEVVEKGGHHYTVDHVSRKVINQID